MSSLWHVQAINEGDIITARMRSLLKQASLKITRTRKVKGRSHPVQTSCSATLCSQHSHDTNVCCIKVHAEGSWHTRHSNYPRMFPVIIVGSDVASQIKVGDLHHVFVGDKNVAGDQVTVYALLT